ncbi:hypothetical protein P5673_030434 [Acropora cervicornis]|uniref:Uncharacterized protein n=1 Tax=Acropora cervicornis TaxID=6130 RepID=A0AAD9PUP1_ACRCE|nr:hypothetical protein P5673_030434 [Acropora cervicornis]
MKRIWPLAVTIFFTWNLWTGYADGTKGKPARIVIPSQVIRTVRKHYVCCSSDGTPPINMSLMNSSAILAESVGTTILASVPHVPVDTEDIDPVLETMSVVIGKVLQLNH